MTPTQSPIEKLLDISEVRRIDSQGDSGWQDTLNKTDAAKDKIIGVLLEALQEMTVTPHHDSDLESLYKWVISRSFRVLKEANEIASEVLK